MPQSISISASSTNVVWEFQYISLPLTLLQACSEMK
jgi:hypothetical protein